MSTPFLGEIIMISWDFAPKGWAFCNGQLLPINQNQALFSILGTQYGGDGRVNFALPDLRGRTAIGTGPSYPYPGEKAGEEFHTLNISELSQHAHGMMCSSNPGNQSTPVNNVFAVESADKTMPYRAGNPDGNQPVNMITNVGGSQPHENRQPYAVVNFVIALQGIFPSQS